MEQEFWKPMVGYEGLYEVSNMGNIRSVTRVVLQPNKNGVPIAYNTLKGKQLKLSKDRYGYLYCTLSKNGKRTQHTAHRMVAEAFLECEEPSKYCVDHINTVRTDNRVENLKWVTHKENANNPITLERVRKNGHGIEVAKKNMVTRKKHGKYNAPMEVFQYSIGGNFISSYESISEAERVTGIKNIKKVVHGKRVTAGGYKWYNKMIEPTQ